MSQPLTDLRLTLDGADLTGKVRPRLVSLSLTEKRGNEADELDLVLDASDGRLALPRKGVLIALQLGWKRGDGVPLGLVDKGSFTVDEVEWSAVPDQIHMTARSADLTARFRIRREQAFTGTTLGGVARQVAAANGLEAAIAPALDGIAVPVLVQHQQSDMALLRRLGREHDAVATVKRGKLILSPIGAGSTATGRTLPPLTLRRADGSGARYREVDRTAGAGAEARWHDTASATRKTVTVAGGSADGDGGGAPHRVRRVFHSEADAKAAAQAAAGRNDRAEAEFEFTLGLGRPDLYPERPVTLADFTPRANARAWIIAELTHQLGGSGLTTSLKLEAKG